MGRLFLGPLTTTYLPRSLFPNFSKCGVSGGGFPKISCNSAILSLLFQFECRMLKIWQRFFLKEFGLEIPSSILMTRYITQY